MTCTGKVSEMEEEQGKEIWHENKLTKREMEALTAFCDTILPVVDVSDSGDEDLIAFYGTSASMLDAPDKVGRLISGEIYHPACGLLRIALLLLSTWYGTFFMCGLASLSKAFPYFQKFAKIGQPKREEILLSWSLSSFYLYKMLFKCIKYLTARVYFAEVNQKNSNPSWKAIGYCGPDLSFVNVDKSLPFKDEQQNDKTPDCMGPIHSCLLHIHQPIPILSHLLHLKGFPSPTTTQPLTLHCDAVVVGSGSGGSVVAGILASSGYKVLLLEKGQYFPGPNLSLLEGPTSKAMYEGKSIIATDDIGALLLAGSTLGGGSTINWSASIQTPKHVRDEWCDKHGLLLFGSTEFDHALDEVCEKMGVQNEVREEGFNNAVLRKGCEELGFDVRRVPINAPPDHYCGWCHLGCKDGKKKSTLETWLKDFAKSGNGFILLSCRATKVMHKKALGKSRNRAYGIMAETEDKKLQFLIESKVTVIASGALNTPGLLKRSGLKNPNIGKNLHIHPCAMGWGYFPAEPGSWPEASKRSYQGGILTSMSTQVANFDASGYGAVLQTPALHPSMFATLTPWISAADYRERMLKFSRTAHIFALVRDKGSGTVDYPLTVTHRLNPDDEENLGKGLEVILKVLVAAGAEEVGTHHCGGERVKGRDEKGLERLIEGVKKRGFGDLGCPISSAHQMGSCRMGVGPEEGAVGPRGETWEVEGLFVADTSVFPTALGVNPMVTVQAIAYCVAQSVVEVLKRKV